MSFIICVTHLFNSMILIFIVASWICAVSQIRLRVSATTGASPSLPNKDGLDVLTPLTEANKSDLLNIESVPESEVVLSIVVSHPTKPGCERELFYEDRLRPMQGAQQTISSLHL